MYKQYDLSTPYDFVLSIIQYVNITSGGANFIPLTTFINGSKPSVFSTYNEKFVSKDNDMYTLSFSISMYAEGKRNPFIDSIVNQRKLRLQTIDKNIDFVITTIKPVITKDNIIYTVTAQDVFSIDGAKTGLGLTYDSTDTDTYPDEDIGPFNIKVLTQKILKYANCTLWKVDSSLCASLIPNFPADLIYNNGDPSETLSSISLNGSNLYNAIVTIATLFNARIKITYSDSGIGGTIGYDNINFDKFTGYQLRDNSNITQLSYSTTSNTYFPIMNVIGGTDSNGYTVSILPTMPTALQSLLYNTMLHTSDMNINSVYSFMGAPTLSINENDEVVFKYNNNVIEADSDFSSTINFNFLNKETGDYYISTYKLTFLSTEPTVDGINTAFKIITRQEHIATEDGDELEDVLYYALYERVSTIIAEQVPTFWEDAEAGKLEDSIKSIARESDCTENEYSDMISYCKVIDKKIPSASSMLYDFSYLYDNNLMPRITYDYLNKSFGKELRNINLQLQFATQKYYELSSSRETIIDLLEEKAAAITANYAEVEGLITNPTTTMIDENNFYSYKDSSIAEADSNLALVLTTIMTPINLMILKQFSGTDWIENLRISLKEMENTYKKYCYTARKEMNSILDATRLKEDNSLTANSPDDDVITLLASNWIEYANYAGYSATYKKYKVFLDETIYFTLAGEKPSGTYAYMYVGGLNNATADVERTFPGYVAANYGKEIDQQPYQSFLHIGYFTAYYEILDSIEKSINFNAINNLPEGLYSIKDFYTNLQLKRDDFWKNLYDNYGNYLLSTTYTDSTQYESTGLYITALKKFISYTKPTPSYSASIIRYEGVINTLQVPIHVGDYVYLYNELLFKEKSNNINFIVTFKGKHENGAKKLTKIFSSDSVFDLTPVRIEDYFDPYDSVYYTRVYGKIYQNGVRIYDRNKTLIIKDFNGWEIKKIDYNYESVPVKLHITNITNVMRAKSISLTLSDTARTDALLGKLIYAVRNK